jgi:hypothetical protein
MDILQIKKILTPLIVIGILGYFGYILFIQAPVSQAIVDETAIGDGPVSGIDILTLITKLKNASIDQALFSSNLFAPLKDFSPSLTPESQGRPNPFAPIGNDVGGGGTGGTVGTTTRRN